MTTYYPACNKNAQSITDALSKIGVDSSMKNRKAIAALNNISNYVGLEEQNIALLNLLKQGKLIKSKGSSGSSNVSSNNSNNSNISSNEMMKNLTNSNAYGGKTNAMTIIGQIMLNNGYEAAFVAGLLANIYHEGNFGYFESSKYVSHPEKKPNYLKFMDDNYDYANKYSGKCVTDVNINDLKTLCDKLKKDNWNKGKFGLGIIQWTGERTWTLVNHYVAEANGAAKLNMNQVIAAEGKFVMSELKGGYSSIYNDWKKNNANNICSENAAYNAASQICLKYEIPANKDQRAKERGETAKKVFKNMNGN